ncbi:MAG: hypothetical protein EBX40_03715, partial [Gammaproteobacteria bacterium]|nr:hypothetical protein [Gammaproteobacteria bacterium]
MTLTHGSFFTGFGGFDLAAEAVGWQNVLMVEREPFCQRLLKYWFPEKVLLGDIKTANFYEFKGKIDVLSGGFPCQPFSVAGKRRGAEDDRYLWPEML